MSSPVSEIGFQEPHSERIRGSFERAGRSEAVADVLKTFDGEQWVQVPTPESRKDGDAEKDNEEQELVNAPPFEGQCLEEVGMEEGIWHQGCGNGAGGSEKVLAGVTQSTIMAIQDVDDIAGPDPKALMADVASPEATASTREVVQLMPGSWPNHVEGKFDRTSDVEDQDQGKDRADLSLPNRDLTLLGAFCRLFI